MHNTPTRLCALLLVLTGPAWAASGDLERQQQRVAERGAKIMPFSLSKTVHQFVPDADGGIQRVLARDPNDSVQIALIRTHLQRIAQQFQQRDFSAPRAIHGADMPGLNALQAAKPEQLAIHYQETASGAEISYRSADAGVIHALHEWFNAQVNDHGADAEMAGPHQHHPNH